ncbi:hypothetical protein ACFL0Y_04365 [Patescibacteria group bacterium]
MLSRINILKNKLVIIGLIAALLLPVFSKTALAFSSGPNETYPFQFMNAVFQTDEMNLQSFVWETMRAVIMSIIILGIDNPESLDNYDRIRDIFINATGGESSLPEYIQKNDGALFQMAKLIGAVYDHPPASGVRYLAHIGERLDLVKPVYAQDQGLGWRKFDYLIPVWSAFRNVSYIFFVLMLIVLGFAIMFRVKISPQAVVTIQSVIPRIVVSLILITFSYAIVGFMVDLMYVIINFVIFLFGSIDFGFPPATQWIEDDVIKAILPNTPTTNDARLAFLMIGVGVGPLAVVLIVMILLAALGGGLIILTGGISGVITAISLLLSFILFIVLFMALIKVLWTLIKAYVNIVLALVFAPFILLAGALPGSNAIGGWFKNLLANLAVWPTIFVMAFLAGFLAFQGLTTEGGAVENLIFLPLLGVGVLLLTGKAADMIKGFISGQPFQYGAALGQAFGPLSAVGGMVGAGAQKYGSSFVQDQAIPAMVEKFRRPKPTTGQTGTTVGEKGSVERARNFRQEWSKKVTSKRRI